MALVCRESAPSRTDSPAAVHNRSLRGEFSRIQHRLRRRTCHTARRLLSPKFKERNHSVTYIPATPNRQSFDGSNFYDPSPGRRILTSRQRHDLFTLLSRHPTIDDREKDVISSQSARLDSLGKTSLSAGLPGVFDLLRFSPDDSPPDREERALMEKCLLGEIYGKTDLNILDHEMLMTGKIPPLLGYAFGRILEDELRQNSSHSVLQDLEEILRSGHKLGFMQVNDLPSEMNYALRESIREKGGDVRHAVKEMSLSGSPANRLLNDGKQQFLHLAILGKGEDELALKVEKKLNRYLHELDDDYAVWRYLERAFRGDRNITIGITTGVTALNLILKAVSQGASEVDLNTLTDTANLILGDMVEQSASTVTVYNQLHETTGDTGVSANFKDETARRLKKLSHFLGFMVTTRYPQILTSLTMDPLGSFFAALIRQNNHDLVHNLLAAAILNAANVIPSYYTRHGAQKAYDKLGADGETIVQDHPIHDSLWKGVAGTTPFIFLLAFLNLLDDPLAFGIATNLVEPVIASGRAWKAVRDTRKGFENRLREPLALSRRLYKP